MEHWNRAALLRSVLWRLPVLWKLLWRLPVLQRFLLRRTGIIHTAISAAIMFELPVLFQPHCLPWLQPIGCCCARTGTPRPRRLLWRSNRWRNGAAHSYATRAYERRHGLPGYGVIDRRLLTTMGIA